MMSNGILFPRVALFDLFVILFYVYVYYQSDIRKFSRFMVILLNQSESYSHMLMAHRLCRCYFIKIKYLKPIISMDIIYFSVSYVRNLFFTSNFNSLFSIFCKFLFAKWENETNYYIHLLINVFVEWASFSSQRTLLLYRLLCSIDGFAHILHGFCVVDVYNSIHISSSYIGVSQLTTFHAFEHSTAFNSASFARTCILFVCCNKDVDAMDVFIIFCIEFTQKH